MIIERARTEPRNRSFLVVALFRGRRCAAGLNPFCAASNSQSLPMLRDVAEPVEAGGFEGRVFGEAGGAGGGGREAAGDGAGDERGALLLQPLDQLPLLRHQS